MDKNAIKRRLSEALPDAQIEVAGDDGAHFRALLVWPGFEGKRTIERHRVVYEILGDVVGNEIHALSLSTLTPEEVRPGS